MPRWIAFAPISPRVTLDWHSATQDHRSHLSAFSCTLPDHGYFDEDEGFVCHDYPWELDVQDYIRSLRVPASPPEFLIVGYDSDGLAAVLAIRVSKLDRFAFIQAVAVAQRASGQGLAAEAIDLAPMVMRKYKIGDQFTVQARIDPDNLAAKSAFLKAGYEPAGYEFNHESWARNWA